MTYTYAPTGVCSSQIDLELEDGVIRSVAFTGGCNGNLQGISRLVTGMRAQEAIERLQGHPVRLEAHQLPRPAFQSPDRGAEGVRPVRGTGSVCVVHYFQSER